MRRGWTNQIYDQGALAKGLLFVGLMLFACQQTYSVAYAVFYPVVLMAFVRRKPGLALLGVLLMSSFLCTNNYFVPKSLIYAYVQRGGIVLFGAGFLLSLLSRGVSPMLAPLLGVFVYVLYMIIPSVFGWSMIISLLKIALFVSTLTAWLGVCNGIVKTPQANVPQLRSAMLSYAVFMLIGSFVLLGLPQIGQMGLEELTASEIAARTEVISLFKGMTAHSQALGPVAAMTLVLVLGDYVFGVRKGQWLYNVLLFCGVIVLWKTSSRTAMATFLFGTGIIFLTLFQARLPNLRWKGKVRGVFLAIGGLGLMAVLLIPSVRTRALGFIVKYNSNNSVVLKNVTLDDITSSRRGAFENPLANWRKSPAIGNGFQVSEDMRSIRSDDFKRLLSAPIEKGTWIVAILEEGGVFGMLIFCGWVLVAWVLLGRRQCYIGRALLGTLLVANLGEFTIFSLSYLGSLQWVLVMTGVILDFSRLGETDRRAWNSRRFGTINRIGG